MSEDWREEAMKRIVNDYVENNNVALVDLDNPGLYVNQGGELKEIHTASGEENIHLLGQYMREWQIEPWDVM